MSHSLTKYMAGLTNKNSHIIVELVVASAIIIILTSSTIAALIVARQLYSPGITEQNLHQAVTILMNTIIKGKSEPGGNFRLSEAVSYYLSNISELHFVGTDGQERWYFLNNTQTAILYHHPTATGIQDEVIYTAPQGAVLTLRFWIPSGAIFANTVVGIDVGLSQNMLGINTTSSLTTMVNIRNHPA